MEPRDRDRINRAVELLDAGQTDDALAVLTSVQAEDDLEPLAGRQKPESAYDGLVKAAKRVLEEMPLDERLVPLHRALDNAKTCSESALESSQSASRSYSKAEGVLAECKDARDKIQQKLDHVTSGTKAVYEAFRDREKRHNQILEETKEIRDAAQESVKYFRERFEKVHVDCIKLRDETREARDHAIKAWHDGEDLEKRVEKARDEVVLCAASDHDVEWAWKRTKEACGERDELQKENTRLNALVGDLRAQVASLQESR